MWSEQPPCGYNEVYKAVYFYESQNGPQCGMRYYYCYTTSPPPYQEGCTTPYFWELYNGCYCP